MWATATSPSRSNEVPTYVCVRARLRQIESELIRSGDGALDRGSRTEASCADKDAIDVRIDQIGTELSEVEKNLSEARDARASAQVELRRMQGPSVASEKAEEAQAMLASLREDVVRYAGCCGVDPLGDGIEDYRHKNQAPTPTPRRRSLSRDDHRQLRAARGGPWRMTAPSSSG